MPEENNPYHAPESDVQVQDPELNDLASRWLRLFASLIDGLIGGLITLPLILHYGIFDMAIKGQEMDYGMTIFFALFGVVAFMLVHGYLLKTRGQTVGKLALGIRIVTLDGKLPYFPLLIAKRYVPLWVLQFVPALNLLGLVDALLIFRSDKRCGHDLIAGTKVIKIVN